VVGNHAREMLLTHPERTAYSVKRLMGRGVADVADEMKLFPFHLTGVKKRESSASSSATAPSPRRKSRPMC
jgi:molecular chaperone DnaK (HSP70)